MPKVIHQNHNVKPQKPLCNGKNLIRKQNLNMFLPLGILVLLTIISFFTLSSSPTSAEDGNNNATDNASADVGVNVGLACTFGGDSTSHTVILNNGNYKDDIEGVILHTICNGNGNYTIQAIGYTDSNNDGIGEDGNNTMHLAGSSNTTYDIPTGTTLDGTTSNWAMKLANSTGNTATIENGYGGFSIIPSTSTLVASYNATSNQTTDSTLQTTYGVSISPNQPAGTYTGQVKYTMNYTANPPYIQDYTLSQCRIWAKDGNVTVIDKRDGSDYTVRYINGACWMTQNLRITHTSGQPEGTILGKDSDFSAESITFDGDLTSGDSYTDAYYHTPNESDLSASGLSAAQVGAWYNFCAAAAKSGAGACSNSSTYSGSESICPSGWHLPTLHAGDGATTGDIYRLGTAYSSANASAFSPIYGGYYNNGVLGGAATHAYWWSSTANYTFNQYYLSHYDGRLTTAWVNKRRGYFIRCVRTS